MSWLTKKGFNLRQTVAFTTDNTGELCFPDSLGTLNMAAYPQSATLDSDTFNWGWSVGAGNDGCRNRSANIPSAGDHRLAGMHFDASGAVYTLKLQIGNSPGQYKIWAGFCDQTIGTSGTVTFALRDSNGTLLTHAGLTALTANQVYDINGNVYASGAAWAAAADGAGLAATVNTTDTSNGNGGPFLFLDIGNGTTYTPLSHFAIQFLGNGPVPPSGPLALGGNAPSVVSGLVVVPFTAQRAKRDLLIPSRNIFLPQRQLQGAF